MSDSTHTRIIALTLENPEEMFVGPTPGLRRAEDRGKLGWDGIGAVLGEAGVDRLLRLLHQHPEAGEIVIRLWTSKAPTPEVASTVEVSQALLKSLRAWIEARMAVNRLLASTARRYGAKMLAYCTIVLGAVLAIAWLLQNDGGFGPPGPMRTLIAEALIIAGWVVMWRPLELLFFDPMRPLMECRVLSRAMQLPMRVEVVKHAEETRRGDGHAAD